MDPRNALRLPEDDGNASTISAKLSIIPLLSFPCLTRESKKYKALAHDMQAESNALQQRFLPQPVLRSSWQQLVMFGLEPDISFTDSRVKHGTDRGEEKRPAMTKRKISMNMTEEKK